MRTTKNGEGVPRLLVLISKDSKMQLVEKEITTLSGEKIKLCTKAPSYWEVDKFELSVRVGQVIGFSDGVDNVKVGDIALIDYIVDADPDFTVCIHENGDKLVSVPCQSSYHTKTIWATSYYQPIVDPKTQMIKSMMYTGEKNSLMADVGDYISMSLVIGIVSGEVLTPERAYVFCEKRVVPSGLIVGAHGLLQNAPEEDWYIRRKVLFAHPDTGLKSGDWILANLDSAFEQTIFEKTFEVINEADIIAID